MHRPEIFREDRVDVMHALMRAYPFATLVRVGADGPEANHLPLLLDAAADDAGVGRRNGVLRGHIARANPMWRETDRRVDVLAIFHGPHHYVTPSWYPSKAAHGKVVPTWNYAVVHAYGRLAFYDDAKRLRDHVAALTASQEASRDEPWALADAPEDFIAGMVNGSSASNCRSIASKANGR